ncbi:MULTISPECIES: small ribosomal subunit biogenesis GTPase RsgA [unclassified Modicisalibacter]|uniref:small ribosomal subunit biogenesis GTPase RsgA n=1 Tax=unclassified Modicisalibacter TaxID=2679913 RepID=UPI001CCDC0C7|nr:MULTISPECIES: small ribosomal subunit biogenesis GTPase RsgA [unclassified Modicisalibacter]MBZ9557434.1 small ribosomal subunit biogenesis GTPase RsgA [Modicisalibacter sp. R2A 31.J]MBZ9573900.1 small ribosomal subunit biogenesis GTPase RsgA [Modicisalibacter sp. MOD 31.J]
MSKRKLTRQQRWRIEKIQAERAARADKQTERESQALEAGEYGHEQPGRVIAHFGRSLDIRGNDDDALHRCHLRANLDSLVTGDRVIWRQATDGSGVVVARDARDNVLERPDPRGQLKPVAANIDQILIVFAVEPAPFANLIDRYLVAAEATGITPVLVLNKTDLLPEGGGELGRLLERYRALGYQVVRATTRGATGLDALHAQLTGRTSVFVGQSGVGKSSLIDRLLPDEALRIGALSEESRKGTHTTTTARLYTLPAGGELVDSPGIREFGLGHLDETRITDGFIEFRDYLGRCRFRDCRHRNEPGCALLDAVDREAISAERFASYRRILDGLDDR